MNYSKKYPIPQIPDDFLTIKWEKGYSNIELYHKDRSIILIPSAKSLKKGQLIHDKELGKIELKFSDRPISINVIVNDIHSPVNTSHPAHEMNKFASIFWIVAVFGLILSAIEVWLFRFVPPLMIEIAIFDIIVVAIYFISAIYIAKSKVWAFWLGFGTFLLMFLMIFTNGIISYAEISLWLNIIIRAIFLLFMLKMIKTVVAVKRHQKYILKSSVHFEKDILDN